MLLFDHKTIHGIGIVIKLIKFVDIFVMAATLQYLLTPPSNSSVTQQLSLPYRVKHGDKEQQTLFIQWKQEHTMDCHTT